MLGGDQDRTITREGAGLAATPAHGGSFDARSFADYIAEILTDGAPDRRAYVERALNSADNRSSILKSDNGSSILKSRSIDCGTWNWRPDIDRFDFAMPVSREDGLLIARPARSGEYARVDQRGERDHAPGKP